MSKKNSKKSKPLIKVKKRFVIFNNADGDLGTEDYEFGENEVIMFDGIKDFLAEEHRISDLRLCQWALKARVGDMLEFRYGYIVRVRK